MTGYVFTYGVDGFGADVAPANEIGCYLDFEMTLDRLIELNSEQLKRDGYLDIKEAAKDWGYKTKNKIVREIWKDVFFNREPPFDYYAIEKIEIFEK